MKERSISIVGAGRLGIALARCLDSAGYRVCEIVAHTRLSPEVRRLAHAVRAIPTTLEKTKLMGDLLWLCLPDSSIEAAAAHFGSFDCTPKTVFHSSGVLTSDILVPLRAAGASVASVHPLMTFARGSTPDLKDVPFAIEGDRIAVLTAKRIARRLGGIPVTVRKRDKPAYHLFATLICPLLVSLLAVSEKAARLAGISPSEARTRMLPIIRQTIANFEHFGPSGAFTGPFVRGDVETVRVQLKTLSGSAATKAVYVSLAEAALQNLPHRQADEIRSVLRESLRR